MAINFGTQFAITGFTLHLKDVAMATTFYLSMGYNFGCMIASDTLFDSRGGFSGSECDKYLFSKYPPKFTCINAFTYLPFILRRRGESDTCRCIGTFGLCRNMYAFLLTR